MARGSRLGFKSTLCVAAAKAAGDIVSILHTTCSALWRGFGPQYAPGSQRFRFVYNAEAQCLIINSILIIQKMIHCVIWESVSYLLIRKAV